MTITRHIYLDSSATTRPEPEVIKIVNTIQNKFWGNPSSIHQMGIEAAEILEKSSQDGHIYNLLGQQINRRKGIYIEGGEVKYRSK